MGERLPYKQDGGGSNPSAGTVTVVYRYACQTVTLADPVRSRAVTPGGYVTDGEVSWSVKPVRVR
jgi:hypothetical protein